MAKTRKNIAHKIATLPTAGMESNSASTTSFISGKRLIIFKGRRTLNVLITLSDFPPLTLNSSRKDVITATKSNVFHESSKYFIGPNATILTKNSQTKTKMIILSKTEIATDMGLVGFARGVSNARMMLDSTITTVSATSVLLLSINDLHLRQIDSFLWI
mmetsp:Transcript_8814/g.18827  ORF Transcript_8814/g.18827 Transcript_8814/m.18827 type:complete len:160 (+) Transcript_8814:62-541(+)